MGSPDLRSFQSVFRNKYFQVESPANLNRFPDMIFRYKFTLYRMGSPDLRSFPSEIKFSGEKSANLNLGHEYIRYIVWGVQI